MSARKSLLTQSFSWAEESSPIKANPSFQTFASETEYLHLVDFSPESLIISISKLKCCISCCQKSEVEKT